MSNSNLISAYIQDELIPDITEHAVLVIPVSGISVHEEVTMKIYGHSLTPWQRLRFRFGF